MEKRINRKNLLRSSGLTLVAIGLSIVFWFLEALLHVLIWEGSNLFEEIFTPQSHEVWMRLTIMSLFIAFGFYADKMVTARRKAEEAAILANVELTQIFNSAADGMRVIDRDFNVLRANETFLTLVGLDEKDILGKKCYEVFWGHRCDTPQCPLKLVLDNAERVEFDSEKSRQDGLRIPCIVTATPFHRPDGELIGIVEDFKDISERKQSELEIMESRERLRELTSHLRIVREEEQNRIQREIHDELGQALTALNMDLYWLRKRLPPDDHEVLDKTRAMSELIGNTVDSVRRICSELRPWLLNDFGLSAAIEWLTKDFTKRTAIPCEIKSDPDDVILDEDLSIAIYRITQEALTNIIRYAEADHVRINLMKKTDLFEMSISDDGKGMDAQQQNKSHSFGLIGIQERVHDFGGEVHIDSGSYGTTIHLAIPLAGRLGK